MPPSRVSDSLSRAHQTLPTLKLQGLMADRMMQGLMADQRTYLGDRRVEATQASFGEVSAGVVETRSRR
jgi:hypothetical protein